MSRNLLILIVATAALVRPVVVVAADKTPAPTAAPTSTRETEALEEVTVTAKRPDLEQRVSKFVYEVAGLQNREGMPRWREPVCPLVGGLPRDEGEFILGRISDIAREAGVPLAAEDCRPNLFITVTPNPQRFLSRMTLHTRLTVFTGAYPSVIEEFIRTPRPARVWYKMMMRTPDGAQVGDANRSAKDEGSAPAIEATASYAKLNVIWTFSKVLVVIDQARLKAVSRGQFADYVAMVGLADLKPDMPLGNAPTILKLFDGDPSTESAEMSSWDMAYLKSLYATDQTSKGQRGQIAHAIMKQIAH